MSLRLRRNEFCFLMFPRPFRRHPCLLHSLHLGRPFEKCSEYRAIFCCFTACRSGSGERVAPLRSATISGSSVAGTGKPNPEKTPNTRTPGDGPQLDTWGIYPKNSTMNHRGRRTLTPRKPQEVVRLSLKRRKP